MKRVRGFAVCHISYALLRRIAVLGTCMYICGLLLPTEWRGLSVCQSVTLVSPAKTAEAIELPFGLRTRVGPRNHVLHGVQLPHGKRPFWGETGEPL